MNIITGRCIACNEVCWLIDHPSIPNRLDWVSDGGIMCLIAPNTLHSVPKVIGLPKGDKGKNDENSL